MAILKKYTEEGIPQNQRYKYSDAVNIGNEPIIQKDIPISNSTTYQTTTRLGRGLDDLKRVATLLTQKPGLKFIANTAALGVIDSDNKKIHEEARKPKEDRNPLSFGSSISLDNIGGVAKTLATTLAQVPVNGTGTHFVRGDKKGLRDMITIFTGPLTSDPPVIESKKTNDILEDPSNSDNEEYRKDLIKFRFTIVKPVEDDNNPIEYQHLFFNAYLTQLDDTYNGDWNNWKYNGRAENFYTYSGFERTVGIGFKIAAANKQEMFPIYNKINHLASVTAPTYSESGIMKGNFVKVTIGDYLDNTPGIITNVTYNWSQEYPWDIGLDSLGREASNQQQLPTILDCSLAFTPIHSFVPQQGFQFEGTSYIGRKASGETGAFGDSFSQEDSTD